MNQATTGRFWAVGVGPGDPELLTLKALRLVQAAHVVYHAGPSPDRGRAFEIIEAHLRPEQECRVVLTEPMAAVHHENWREHYRPGVEQIAADCRAGRDVVCVTEGDPTLYSTAACVWQLLRELHPDIPIEVVPGVSSVTAAAARAGWPLAQRDEPLLILPATYHAADLLRWIEAVPTLCLLKPGAAMAQLAEALGPEREAIYLENVGTPQEWQTRDVAKAIGRKCYFSIVLIRTLPARSASEGDSHPSLALRAGGGTIQIVGLGPGAPDLLTSRALAALRSADAIVGFDGYLRALAPLHLRAELCGSPIGAETERATQALELARDGRRVALVSSGDAGVYGMASLLFEAAGQAPEVSIEVVPGVTAALSAAALLGAPLGHDFACVSLSDLLTPWDTIAERLDAAARGDFVLALYNPVSRQRTWQLPRACDILLRHRRPETPVGIVDKAYRPGVNVRLTTLGELTIGGVGMETTLIIGSSQTRVVNGRLVTPRGYQRSFVVPPSGGSTSKPPEGGTTNNATGQRIMDESFAIIERELGEHGLPSWAFAVVRRMIHASADFDFARLLRWSDDFEAAVAAALRSGVVVTDTEMVRQGIRVPQLTVRCHLNDAEVRSLAESAGLTRSAAGIRVAARHEAAPLLVIGNAPTALAEALRLVEAANWRPAAIIGMPVGFVGVEEAKTRLLEQRRVPFLTCVGRKGGSAVAAAAVNALEEWVGRLT